MVPQLNIRKWIEVMAESPKLADRRRDGWTWAKEIVGTCIGVATVMSVPTAWMFNSLNTLQRNTDIHEVRIKKLEEAAVDGKKSDEKVQEQLGKIYDLVQDVRVQQARQGSGITR